jgi:hypothetical protein
MVNVMADAIFEDPRLAGGGIASGRTSQRRSRSRALVSW